MMYKTTWTVLRRTFDHGFEHEVPRLAAALAFYTLLSLAPLIVLVLSIVSFVFGHSTAQYQLLAQVQNLVGQQGTELVKSLMEQTQKPASGAFASLLGVFTLLFGASGVFGELRSALHKMWVVQPQNEAGFVSTIKSHLFSFGMVLAVGFLLMVSLVITTVLAAFGKFFGGLLPLPEFVLSTINFVVSVAGTTGLFALIFRYVPETEIPWKVVGIGSIVTALLFTIGKSLIGLYLGKAAVVSAYGAAGSLVVVIVWVYYSAIIFLFGAAFTYIVDTGAHKPR